MSDEAFDPRALVLRRDIHPVELWSPGAHESAGFVLRGLKTHHEPGDVGGPVPSYAVYWCRLEAQVADGAALVLEGDPQGDPAPARRGLEAMGRELARAIGTDLRLEDFRGMSAKEYFL